MVIVGSAEGLKRVFQTNQRNYVKDLDFSFHPFLPILGTGLVTAQGKLWQQQRLLMAPTLRVDVLDDVVRPLLLSQTSSAGCNRPLETEEGDDQQGTLCRDVRSLAL